MRAGGNNDRWLRGLTGFIIRHQSLMLALAVGVAAFVFTTSGRLDPRNLLASWNIGAICYLALSWRRMMTADVHRIRRRAADLDFSDVLILLLASAAALASIGGIALELHGAKSITPDEALARAGVAIVTILISWVFLHTLFTVHYAHYFYSGGDDAGGLKFPEGVAEPVYWDFLYFSFIIGVASQTADVAITSMPMRRLSLLHSVLSFLFNTTILALAVNVGASLL